MRRMRRHSLRTIPDASCDVSDMYADIVQVPASAKPSRTCREGLALPGSALRRRCTGDAQPKHVKKLATGMIPPRTYRRARRGCEAAVAKRCPAFQSGSSTPLPSLFLPASSSQRCHSKLRCRHSSSLASRSWGYSMSSESRETMCCLFLMS